MRALFVATTSTTAYTFLLPFACYLRERGHAIEFACSTQSFVDAPSRATELREAGFNVHEISFARTINPLQDIQACWNLMRLIRTRRYHIVHTHTSKAGFIGRIAAKAAGCLIVIHTAHDFFFRAYPSGPRRLFFIWLEKGVAPLCDAMLFVSEAVRQNALRYRLKKENNLLFVGNGIDVGQYAGFSTDAGYIRAQYGIGNDNLWVGSVGRLVENKGIDIFLRSAALVFRQCPEARFIIAGDGPLRKDLEALATELGIASCVRFVGHLPETEDVMKLMASLDAFVLPTRREGLGVVYLEAMALQCPVVGSRIAPITEVVKDGRTGILATVDDPQSFAHAILALLESPSLRKQMGSAGRAHVQQEYDLQQVFERTEAVYRRLVLANGLTWN